MPLLVCALLGGATDTLLLAALGYEKPRTDVVTGDRQALEQLRLEWDAAFQRHRAEIVEEAPKNKQLCGERHPKLSRKEPLSENFIAAALEAVEGVRQIFRGPL